MSGAILEAAMDSEATMRQLEPNWNAGMIAASIAISFLGAFTSTQLLVSPLLPSLSFLYTPQSLTSLVECAKRECPFTFQVY